MKKWASMGRQANTGKNANFRMQKCHTNLNCKYAKLTILLTLLSSYSKNNKNLVHTNLLEKCRNLPTSEFNFYFIKFHF